MLWCLIVTGTGMYLLQWKWVQVTCANRFVLLVKENSKVKAGGEIYDYLCLLLVAANAYKKLGGCSYGAQSCEMLFYIFQFMWMFFRQPNFSIRIELCLNFCHTYNTHAIYAEICHVPHHIEVMLRIQTFDNWKCI